MKLLFGTLLLFATLVADASALVIEGFDHPESVVPWGDNFFVSDIGAVLDPKALDGDGSITLLDAAGGVVKKPFNKVRLNSPKGLLVMGETLYIADCNRVVGIDVATGREKVVIDFSSEGTLFLNAIARKDETSFFVSASDIGTVFEVTLGIKPEYRMVAEQLGGPNGMVWAASQKKLYVVGWGTGTPNGVVGVIDLSQKGRSTFTQLSTYQGFLDGAVLVGADLYFSDWVDFKKVGLLKKYNLKSGKVITVPLPQLVAGPAGFYRTTDGTFWIPMMIEGKILVTK